VLFGKAPAADFGRGPFLFQVARVILKQLMPEWVVSRRVRGSALSRAAVVAAWIAVAVVPLAWPGSVFAQQGEALIEMLMPLQQGKTVAEIVGRSPAAAGSGTAFGMPEADAPDDAEKGPVGEEQDDPLAWPEVAGGVQPGDVLLINHARVRVDREGRIWLPGEAPITVMGWSEGEIRSALSTISFAKGRPPSVRVLPRSDRLSGLGVRPFGYETLSGHGKPVLPDPRAPVARDYVVGPGDTFLLQLFGKESAEYELGVTRDGTLLIPRFGPLQVAGLPYDEARALIRKRIRDQAIGVEVGVTMGTLRTIQVFVVGDVVRPGLHVLSAMSTPLHALYAAGGVQEYGSLRNVQVKRGDRVVGEVDLYEFLLSGDSSQHRRLESGDVVFVPPVSATIAVSGLVRRPAIYELKGGETVADVLGLAGGLIPEANEAAVRLQRLEAVRGQTVDDLGVAEWVKPVRDGDLVRVYPKSSGTFRAVRLVGHVAEPGEYPWSDKMRLSDLIPDLGRLLPDADPNYLLIARTETPGGMPAYYQASVARALAEPDSNANIPLRDQDRITVFSVREDRAALLRPDMQRISTEAIAGRRENRVVSVHGAVHFPGAYPLAVGMRLSDALIAAGDVTERAFAGQVLITRFALNADGEGRETRHISVDLNRARAGEPEQDPLLSPGDEVSVRKVPDWQGGALLLSGAVKFPGRYVFSQGESIADVVARAGGLTDRAFVSGIVFERRAVREQANEEWRRAIRDLEKEVAWLESSPIPPADRVVRSRAISAGSQLLQNMRQTELTGRVSVRFEADDSGGLRVVSGDVALVDGDRLHIPERPDSVLVIGEVFHPTAHLYHRRDRMKDYIKQSGGVTRYGDTRRVLVVRADGSVQQARVGRLHSGPKVGPGDVVVVPKKLETFSGLSLATNVSQILYQLALTAAATKAVGLF